MTDRRDPEEEELRELLADLESTLVELRGELDDERRDRPTIPRGLPGGGRPAPRPPRLREVLRFTEEYTIPTLISILEANIRLLRLGGAALRALDPERSAVPADADRDGAIGRALDAGRGFSANRLASGLEELNDAVAGTDAPDPEARELLGETEALSTELQERLREIEQGARTSGGDREHANDRDDTVHLDVADGGENDADGTDDGTAAGERSPEPDVDAELDSIREEVRGPRDDEATEDAKRGNGEEKGGEEEGGKEGAREAGKERKGEDDPSDDADGTALE